MHPTIISCDDDGEYAAVVRHLFLTQGARSDHAILPVLGGLDNAGCALSEKLRSVVEIATYATYVRTSMLVDDPALNREPLGGRELRIDAPPYLAMVDIHNATMRSAARQGKVVCVSPAALGATVLLGVATGRQVFTAFGRPRDDLLRELLMDAVSIALVGLVEDLSYRESRLLAAASAGIRTGVLTARSVELLARLIAWRLVAGIKRKATERHVIITHKYQGLERYSDEATEIFDGSLFSKLDADCLVRHASYLALIGHGGTIDFEVGDEVVICGKRSRIGFNQLFQPINTCQISGECARDVKRTKLRLTVDSLNCDFLFLGCCQGINIGGSKYSPDLQLAIGALETGTLGVISLVLAGRVQASFGILISSLLRDGFAFGDVLTVLASINKNLGHPPTFLLLGDPEMVIPRSDARDIPRRSLSENLGAETSCRVMFFPTTQNGSEWSKYLGRGLFVDAASIADAPYMLVCKTTELSDVGVVAARPTEMSAISPLRHKGLITHQAGLRFLVSALVHRSPASSELASILSRLADRTERVLLAVAGIVEHGMGVPPTQEVSAELGYAATAIQGHQIEALKSMSRCYVPFHLSSHWQSTCRRVEVADSECPLCGAYATIEVFRSIVFPSVTRALVACDLCGVVGDQQDAELEICMKAPVCVSRGRDFSLTIQMRNLATFPVEAAGMAFFRSDLPWNRILHKGAPLEVKLRPRAAETYELSCHAPIDTAPGLYGAMAIFFSDLAISCFFDNFFVA